jgi:lambda repressor-like predicted transcriptional regulator
MLNRKELYKYSAKYKKRWKKYECIIAKNPEYSYWYAKEIIRGRFVLGEKSISKKSSLSYYYAANVLENKFVLGEKEISKESSYSCDYAVHVLKKRFVLGEKIIKNSYSQKAYEKYFNCKL